VSCVEGLGVYAALAAIQANNTSEDDKSLKSSYGEMNPVVLKYAAL
jgi:hypothetical protein